MFFWNCLAFLMIQRMFAIWSLVPLPVLKPTWTSGSSRLKPGLKNFEHCFTSMWDECNCAVVWAFFGIFISPSLPCLSLLSFFLFISFLPFSLLPSLPSFPCPPSLSLSFDHLGVFWFTTTTPAGTKENPPCSKNHSPAGSFSLVHVTLLAREGTEIGISYGRL